MDKRRIQNIIYNLKFNMEEHAVPNGKKQKRITAMLEAVIFLEELLENKEVLTIDPKSEYPPLSKNKKK